MLPCFKCGKTLPNAFPNVENQPSGGTEFRTFGHYGSTFWDSGYEALVLNVCDECLREHTERLGAQKPERRVVDNGPLIPVTASEHFL